MIIDKINVVELEILSYMGKQLARAHGLSNPNTLVFGDLLIVIVMGNFYQFLLIVKHPL